MLPQLRELHRRFARELVVIGVHSGKYPAERVTAHLRDAAVRLDNRHPIVNDRQFRIWRSYAVRAWPTIVVVDPEGYVAGMHAGEFTADTVAPFLARLAADHERKGTLQRGPHECMADPPTRVPGELCFPSRVAVHGNRIAIADGGHHRVLVGELAEDGRRARITRIAGDGTAGFEEGTPGRLRVPQGMWFEGDTLLIADPDNHAVRRLDLERGALSTVAGTGRQLRTRADLDAGALSSPWDVAMLDGTMFIAMAGTHQIWSLHPGERVPRAHAGSGREDITDGPLAEAALAQPMGLATDGERLVVADAESNGVRIVDPSAGGGVRTVVGTGLFDFGDEDGAGDEVRLQHPQAVAVAADGAILVADSYNGALKWIDPTARRATTWLRGFSEPSGLAVSDTVVYVADCDAHRIAVVDRRSNEIGELRID